MRGLDFSSVSGLLTTLIGMVVVTFVMVAIRLMIMQMVQQRRERENRQINERLRTLIAAYKVLGGSFTGILTVDPTHLRDLRLNAATSVPPMDDALGEVGVMESTDRSRRIRDAVEAALSDLILLGTEEQVRLAAAAANELVAGKPVATAELVTSLRNFIRGVLDLEPIPSDLPIPKQGPSRMLAGGGSGGGKGKEEAGARGGGRGDGGAAGGMAMGGGLGLGFGAGLGGSTDSEHDSN
mgnify:FL=1